MARAVSFRVTEHGRSSAAAEHENGERLAVVSLETDFGERSAKQFRVMSDCVWRDRQPLLDQNNCVLRAMRWRRDANKFNGACWRLWLFHGGNFLDMENSEDAVDSCGVPFTAATASRNSTTIQAVCDVLKRGAARLLDLVNNRPHLFLERLFGLGRCRPH